ncbi:hypothetical protein COCON_G00198890 [Conger conger]|uniref:Uncharacterized protein n=1 Tax=Conger conger TaxID=82655 RepID=A0A9Q1HR93_CONCO|nr:hypothetical protein COCON_G00198890 [Conger conger]
MHLHTISGIFPAHGLLHQVEFSSPLVFLPAPSGNGNWLQLRLGSPSGGGSHGRTGQGDSGAHGVVKGFGSVMICGSPYWPFPSLRWLLVAASSFTGHACFFTVRT